MPKEPTESKTDNNALRLTELYDYLSNNNFDITRDDNNPEKLYIKHERILPNGEKMNRTDTVIFMENIYSGPKYHKSVRDDVIRICIQNPYYRKTVKISIKTNTKLRDSKLYKIRAILTEFENNVIPQIDRRYNEEITQCNGVRRMEREFPMLKSDGNNSMNGMNGNLTLEAKIDNNSEIKVVKLHLYNLTKDQAIKVWEVLNPEKAEEEKKKQEKSKFESRFDLIDEQWD